MSVQWVGWFVFSSRSFFSDSMNDSKIKEYLYSKEFKEFIILGQIN